MPERAERETGWIINQKDRCYMTDDPVLDFLRRRFSDPDADQWLSGNCYWMAVILRERFGGEILYDTARGHFLTEIDGKLYDASGLSEAVADDIGTTIIPWDKFSGYDKEQQSRIIRDCVL